MTRDEFVAACDAQCSVVALKGIIRKPAKPVSIEDMNAAIAGQARSIGVLSPDVKESYIRGYDQRRPVI